MMKNIPRTIGNQIFSLKCGFGSDIGQKYSPIWVLVLDLNQNSGFGRTLHWTTLEKGASLRKKRG